MLVAIPQFPMLCIYFLSCTKNLELTSFPPSQ